MDELKNALLASGLEDDTGGGGTPVTHFVGRMLDYEAKEKESDRGGKPYTQVIHMVNELVVKEAKEDYPFDSLTFPISASKKKKTLWGVWIESIKKITGAPVEEQKMNYATLFDSFLRNRMVECKRVDHDMRRNIEGEWKTVPVPSWEVIWIEGIQKVDFDAEALKVLTEAGGDVAKFFRQSLENPIISTDAKFETLTDKSWFSKMEAEGKITKVNENTYSIK